MANTNLANAKNAKNDEFYTQYADIQKEMNAYLDYDRNVFRGKTIFLPCDDPEWSNFTKYFAQHFEELGLRKLISTSYAPESKKYRVPYEPTFFETSSPQYNPDKTKTHGKIFVLERSSPGGKRIDIDALEWDYLEGDGDFRSQEICRLRDEADIIITNPPFSLFREFVAWIMKAEKKYIIIGNKTAITDKTIFPLIKHGKMWIGINSPSEFLTKEKTITSLMNGLCRWFTNIDHGRRHQPLQLMSMAENFKHNAVFREKKQYQKYDNFDAIDIPRVDAIPNDYDGIMGVPITFLDKYCPEQFEIIWRTGDIEWCEKECDFYTPPTKEKAKLYKKSKKTWRSQNPYILDDFGNAIEVYKRIFIRRKQ